jgi:stage V sporulation protein SpoVS
VTAVEEGIVAGAVYKPVDEMVPAVAVQLVAPEEVNCFVCPMVTEVDVGEITCGGSGTNVTAALAEPPGPVAVTVTAVEEGIVAGAVYKPVEETVPAVAVQPVAPEDVNCFVCPSVTEADVGEMDCGSSGDRVTAAMAEPPGPVAVTVTAVEDGIVAGAVNRPVEEMLPALALQLVAPEDVNCFVCPILTVAEVGEIVCGVTNETAKAGPQRVPTLMT